MESYTFNQHRHNYATWTAARAVQRNFTATSNIKYAIDKSGLQRFAENGQDMSQEDYNRLHMQWVESINACLAERKVPNTSYGRAAKIISIYLKTSVIFCNKGLCSRSRLIHPPIEGILLKNLSKLEGLKDLGTIRWTQLSKTQYWVLVDRLTKHFKTFDWRLELYWSPELE